MRLRLVRPQVYEGKPRMYRTIHTVLDDTRIIKWALILSQTIMKYVHAKKTVAWSWYCATFVDSSENIIRNAWPTMALCLPWCFKSCRSSLALSVVFAHIIATVSWSWYCSFTVTLYNSIHHNFGLKFGWDRTTHSQIRPGHASNPWLLDQDKTFHAIEILWITQSSVTFYV